MFHVGSKSVSCPQLVTLSLHSSKQMKLDIKS